MIPELLTIEDAAARMGVARKALRAVAERYGFIIRIGRKPLLDAAQLGELVERCRDHQREPASRGGETRATGTSGTATRGSRPGPMIEDELTKRSPGTSPNRAGR